MVIALELIEGLLLIGSNDIGNVLRGVQVAHPGARMLHQNMVADRVDQVSLAQAHTTVDKKRVVRSAGVFGNLECSGAGKLVSLAGDETVEAEFRNEARAFRMRRSSRWGARGSDGGSLYGLRCGGCLERERHADG